MNPIARMMKRYIRTPLRYALPLLFIGALVLVSISGCTSSTSNTSTSSGGGNTASVTDSINTAYSQGGYTVVTPFTKTASGGNTVYKGVVDDGSKVLQPYRNNITITLASDRATATKIYNASITQAQKNGYTNSIMNQGTSWFADIGSITYPNQQVKITVREPSIIGVNPYGTDVYLNIDSNSYAVCTDYQSPTS